MFDGLWSGVFGGLFDPAISRWLARWFAKYKYRKTFTVTTFCIYAISFVAAWLKFGFTDSLILLCKMLTLPGVLIPVGLALVFALCVFLGSTSVEKKE